MKNYFLLFGMLLMGSIFFHSCTKDTALEDHAEDQLLAKMDIDPVGIPDLVVTNYGSPNIPTTSTDCGPVLPNVGCNGPGGHGFTATIIVANIGSGDVPAGVLEITWVDLTTDSTQVQEASHGGIPAGTSLRFSRPYFLGPCDCPPPYTAFTHSFMAAVNVSQAIFESNYGNNRSPQFDTCDGC